MFDVKTVNIPETQYPVDFERLKTMTAEEVENYYVNELKAFEDVKSLRFFIADMLYQAEQDGSWDLPVVYYEEGETCETIGRPLVETFTASIDQPYMASDSNAVTVSVTEQKCNCEKICEDCECEGKQVTMDEYLAATEQKIE